MASKALTDYKPHHALDEAMVDLLTDLQHYARRYGIDWELALELSVGHFKVESR
jgi:hypothetical protein